MDAAKAKKLDDLFEEREIREKRVYVVDDHHKAFAAWALTRRRLAEPAVLITFDHHTDTRPAFWAAAALKHGQDEAAREGYRQELASTLGWDNDAVVLSSVAGIRHDEHIDAAARCGILRAAFCIQLTTSWGAPLSRELIAYREDKARSFPKPPTLSYPVDAPLTYDAPENGVFVVPHDGVMELREESPEDDESRHASQIIESVYVEDQLARAAQMAKSMGIESPTSLPYILDIDLDVFHNWRSIAPSDAAAFHRLIQGAVAITIATEESCVRGEWLEEAAPPDVERLLALLLQHIEHALA